MNVLLIKGLAREARHWARTPALIEAAIPGAKAHRLDLPGAGTEHRRPSPRSMPAIVRDMRARFLAMRGGEPWVVFGISFGGMVAMCWADLFPEDFRAAVLINTSAANVGHPLERMRPLAVKTLTKTVRMKDPVAREALILSVISNEPEKAREILPAWAAIAREQPVDRRVLLAQIIAASAYAAPAKLRVPTLVLASDHDRFVDSRCSERLARRLGARLERHPTAGHALALDAPEWMAARLAELAAELDR